MSPAFEEPEPTEPNVRCFSDYEYLHKLESLAGRGEAMRYATRVLHNMYNHTADPLLVLATRRAIGRAIDALALKTDDILDTDRDATSEIWPIRGSDSDDATLKTDDRLEPTAGGWSVFPLAYPAAVPFGEPPSLVPQTSNRTLPACTEACTAASGCQGFAACSMGSVGCWTYRNVSGGQLNHSTDCDWHAAPWAAAPPAAPRSLCNLNGNWSNQATNYTTHIEFFQPAGSRNFTLRAEGWAASSSYGSVGPQAGQAFWLMVGDTKQRLHQVIASPLVHNWLGNRDRGSRSFAQ